MPVTEKLYTADDLWQLSHRREFQDRRLELIAGKIIEMPFNGGQHGAVAANLGVIVHDFVNQYQLGYCFAGGTGFQLSRITVLAPDFAFITSGRFPDDLADGYIPFAPDLTVEIVESWEANPWADERRAELFGYGTRMIWELDLDSQTAAIFTPESSYLIDADGMLDGGEVLPGFSLPLRDVYAVLGE